MLFPGERPIEAVRPLVRVCFFGKQIPAGQVESESCVEKVLRRGLRGGAVQCRPGARLFDLVFITRDLPGGAHMNAKFLFLLRLKEADVPKPDIQLRRHDSVGFLQAQFALEVDLRVFIHVENDRGLVAADVFAEARDKVLRALQRFFSGDLKIDGGFGESAEEILLGEHRAQNSKDDPKQQRALVGTRQTVTGHQCLPERSRADSSLYRYAWPGCKFRRCRVVCAFPITQLIGSWQIDAASMTRREGRKGYALILPYVYAT